MGVGVTEADVSVQDLDRRAADSERLTVIEPPSGWRMLDLLELWAYRELLWTLTLRDLKVRYKQTIIGIAWALIQPLATMIVFTLIFSKLARIPSEGFPYPVFLYAGLLPWTFFSGAVLACGGSLVGSAGLVTKVYFPRLIIPLTSIGTNLVDLGISAAMLMALMLYFGVRVTPNLLALPVVLAGVFLLALGVGTLLGALTVAYRDFRYVVPFLLQIWFYATPVVYPLDVVPDRWRWVLHVNPMTGFIDGFRSVFLGKPFDLAGLVVAFAMSVGVLAIGAAYFQQVERRFADVI
jgi:lipopolysaccharide transport system permease protein